MGALQQRREAGSCCCQRQVGEPEEGADLLKKATSVSFSLETSSIYRCSKISLRHNCCYLSSALRPLGGSVELHFSTINLDRWKLDNRSRVHIVLALDRCIYFMTVLSKRKRRVKKTYLFSTFFGHRDEFAGSNPSRSSWRIGSNFLFYYYSSLKRLLLRLFAQHSPRFASRDWEKDGIAKHRANLKLLRR